MTFESRPGESEEASRCLEGVEEQPGTEAFVPGGRGENEKDGIMIILADVLSWCQAKC